MTSLLGSSHTPETATDYCVQLLQLLRSNDTINAHFLWKRIADSVKVDPQLHAVWGIGAASLTEGDPAELTKALAGFAWQPPVAALVDEVRRARVDRTMSIIGRAYSTISLEQVAAMSGLDGGAAAAARCASEGWRVEGNTVHPTERAAASRGSSSHAAAMRQLEQLSTYVMHLEAESTTKLLPRIELLVSETAIRKYLRTNGLDGDAGAQESMRDYVHHLPEKQLRGALAALGVENTDTTALPLLRNDAMARIVAGQSDGAHGRRAEVDVLSP